MIATQSIEYQDKKIVLSATVPLKINYSIKELKIQAPPQATTRVSCQEKFHLEVYNQI